MKPDYYEDFTCIADRCSFTCCREWKIGVDEDTFVTVSYTHLDVYKRQISDRGSVGMTFLWNTLCQNTDACEKSVNRTNRQVRGKKNETI